MSKQKQIPDHAVHKTKDNQIQPLLWFTHQGEAGKSHSQNKEDKLIKPETILGLIDRIKRL